MALCWLGPYRGGAISLGGRWTESWSSQLLPGPGHRVLDPGYNDRDFLGCLLCNVDVQGSGLSLCSPGQLHPRPSGFEGSLGWGVGTLPELVLPLVVGPWGGSAAGAGAEGRVHPWSAEGAGVPG